MPQSVSREQRCPCGKGYAYSECCSVFHEGEATPETAEQLMRSRYAAYALGIVDYLVETTHPDKRDPNLRESIAAWADRADWVELQLLRTQNGGPKDKKGKVEFIAHYITAKGPGELHEVSRFRRYEGKWRYFDHA